MCDFFHGRRRKAGVATLMMALILMAGWIRSSKVEDSLLLRVTDSECELFNSWKGHLEWERIQKERTDLGRGFNWGSTSSPRSAFIYTRAINRCYGFGFEYSQRERSTVLTVPYWSFVCPLTLLSAHLLLIKTRPALSKKAVELAIVEGP